ncbi:class I SAM-dependent methyltransferase [Pseudoduganella lutea]|uniref:class I SAM-dependent methyltransferase n=1 Tax=Pseudoduganella lutea TaxID=321985 RepID=UPI001E4C6576|nr:class I SAM-dependent methyltransferase [Pseudoduganella lutea]
MCDGTVQQGLRPWHAQCNTCRYESAALQVSINEAQAHAAIDEAAREASLKMLRMENFREIVQLARTHGAPGARRLLDVGSAHGWFLEAAAPHFDVLGIEPDAAVGSKAAARGLPVRPGYFPAALAPDETFDAIVFNDVIEHIPDIRSAIAACHARLNPGGILVLNLPNSRGFFYRLSKWLTRAGLPGAFERMWQKSLPSPHLHYFDPANLTSLLQGAGFTHVHSAELAALRADGLKERLAYVGKPNPVKLNTQYLAIRAMIPLLGLFPSDIIVGIYRRG